MEENTNPLDPNKKINLSDAEWKERLTPEQCHILCDHGTEKPGSSPLLNEHRKGTYLCAACGLPLFTSEMKFESGTGWPSFFDAIKGNIETKNDLSLSVPRTEHHCARCGSHQGHLFPDGPAPTGLRYCNNGLSLKFIPDTPETPSKTETAIFAGGCFWCVQEAFDEIPGVLSTIAGYTGGHLENPTYEQVCHENTGHYESLKITFNPSIISYEKLLDIFWHTIDPLDPNGQFADRGESYRSAIFYLDDKQKALALQSKENVEKELNTTTATPIAPAPTFYPAEDYHQEFHKKNPLHYKNYRNACGRDQGLKKIWKKK